MQSSADNLKHKERNTVKKIMYTLLGTFTALASLLLASCSFAGYEITTEEFKGLSYAQSAALLKCQLAQYADEHGTKAAEDYFMAKMGSVMEEKGEVTPMQEELIDDGYSCAREEVDKIAPGTF